MAWVKPHGSGALIKALVGSHARRQKGKEGSKKGEGFRRKPGRWYKNGQLYVLVCIEA
jgi:hypothetical protein